MKCMIHIHIIKPKENDNGWNLSNLILSEKCKLNVEKYLPRLNKETQWNMTEFTTTRI